MSTLAQLSIGTNHAFSPGDFYPGEGGYYIGDRTYPDGDYAIFVAPKSAEVERIWCNYNDGRSNPSELRDVQYWDGYSNTVATAAYGITWEAARYCRAYRGGGHSDWYLPARDEITFIAANAATKLPAGSEQGFRTDKDYWSSSWQNATFSALKLRFYETTTMSRNKDNALVVRPIRKKLIYARARQVVLGSTHITGAGQWVVPDGVTSISVLCVAAGSGGGHGSPGTYGKPGANGYPGINGPARYVNNIPVTPGQVIDYYIGRSDTGDYQTTFGTFVSTNALGTLIALTPATPNGGGHKGYDLITPVVNLGYNSPSYVGQWPGGGGQGGAGGPGPLIGGTFPGTPGTPGGNGAIRIIWPGNRRGFPSTDTTDEFES